MGETDNVFLYLQSAIQIYETYAGVDHPDTAHLYFNLAFSFKERAKIVNFLIRNIYFIG